MLLGQTNKTVKYFDSSNNPLKDSNGVLITSPFPNAFSSVTQTIRARVTNNVTNTNNGIPCYDEVFIKFIVDIKPNPKNVDPLLLKTCDDEADPALQDGIYKFFDTSTIDSTIRNGQTTMELKYFDGLGNPLSSPLPNPFTSGTQNVKVIITNPLNTTCPETIILPFVVNKVPKIKLTGDELICLNLPSFYIRLTAGILDGTPTTDYTYIWKKNGTLLPITTATYDVNSGGVYTVEVKNIFKCSRTRTITVLESDIAHLNPITVNDLAENNTITVNITGIGNYEYSLDEPYGPFQTSNVFENVTIGFHTVYINDIKGCGIAKQEVAVVGSPKFFTPNGDGFNDYWNIKGVSKNFNSQSIIYIFDRFGKLITQIQPSDNSGWDGTYNGQLLPADDYWFTLQVEDGRVLKGHFSLKR